MVQSLSMHSRYSTSSTISLCNVPQDVLVIPYSTGVVLVLLLYGFLQIQIRGDRFSLLLGPAIASPQENKRQQHHQRYKNPGKGNQSRTA